MCSVEERPPPVPCIAPPTEDLSPSVETNNYNGNLLMLDDIPMVDAGSCADSMNGAVKECIHRSKRKLIDSKKTRISLKKEKSKCDECTRANEKSIYEGFPAKVAFVCMSCGAMACREHARKHAKATRTGLEHPFVYNIDNGTVRCEICEVPVPVEDGASNDPVRAAVNDIRSESKNKEAIKEAKNGTAQKPLVEGRSTKLIGGQTVVIPIEAASPNGTSARSDSGTELVNGTTSNGFHAPSESIHPAKSIQKTSSKEKEKERNGATKRTSELFKGSKENGRTPASNGTSTPISPSTSNGVSTAAAVEVASGSGLAKGSGSEWGPDKSISAKGLSNLGNTCFFNSVMQCMMHTHHLQYYCDRFGRVRSIRFSDDLKPIIINDEKIPLEPATLSISELDSPINDALRAFINDFKKERHPSPNSIFNEIARKAVRFRSMAQQDAHELLRYLLDGLCSEETTRYQRAIGDKFGIPVKSSSKPDPETAKKAKAYLQAAGRPLLDAVFGGRLLQTILCCECKHVSERNEYFLDLSVPLAGGESGGIRRERAGTSERKLSKHQQKKQAKEKKRASQKGKRSAGRRSRGPSTTEEETTKTNGENGEAAEDELASKLDETHLSEEDMDEDEDEENREDAGFDRLDFTKVLAPIGVPLPSGRSVLASLLEFTAEERLEGANRYECEECCTPLNKKNNATGTAKKRVDALKRYLIYTPPVVLTIHLKRFQQVSGHVHFPLLLDAAPFCCKNVERVAPGETRVIYSLYGIVSHSGELGGGHYVAYVKSRKRIPQAHAFLEAARASCADAQVEAASLAALSSPVTASPPTKEDLPRGTWYFCSDSRTSITTEEKVLGIEAYILFYERVY